MGSNHRSWSKMLPSSALNHQPTNSVYFWSLLCQATEQSEISTEGFSYHTLNLALTPSIFWVPENSLSLLERCLDWNSSRYMCSLLVLNRTILHSENPLCSCCSRSLPHTHLSFTLSMYVLLEDCPVTEMI